MAARGLAYVCTRGSENGGLGESLVPPYTRGSVSLSRLRAGTWSDVLRWAREHDCPWYAWTCHAAAKCGHLEVLRWAQAHGCL